jgi:hypothetical protein
MLIYRFFVDIPSLPGLFFLSIKREGKFGLMKKIDLKKDLKQYYQSSAKDAAAVDVPKFRFLMIDGKGDPNKSAEYQQAVEALFAVSYTAKFMFKKGPQQIDYGVMPHPPRRPVFGGGADDPAPS